MSATPYRSGHCGIGHHVNCTGSYAGTACSCKCHAKDASRELVSTGTARSLEAGS